MLTVVTHPDGVEKGRQSPAARALIPDAAEDIGRLVLPSKTLNAEARMQIYANMYFWRLVDILYADFKGCHHALVAETFTRVARAYLVAHPSRSGNLRQLSKDFPRFLADVAEDVPQRAFIAELALLERSCEDIFDAPRSTVASANELSSLAPEAFGAARFRFIEASRLLAFEYPVNAFLTAVRNDETPSPPETTQRSHLLLYRRDWVVRRTDLSREQYQLLRRLQAGETLGEALQAVALLPGVDVETLTTSLGPWFQNWTGSGLFASIQPPG